MPDSILSLRGVTKHFPGVVALESVDLEIERGEVHILVGENGAGKSTLMKILSGVYPRDGGEILYRPDAAAPPVPYNPHSVHEALQAGLRTVYQEFNLLSYLSVAENIFFDRLPRRAGMVDFRRLYRETEGVLAEVGLKVAPSTRVEMLGVAEMQLLEIAKALSSESKVLILDEPTATLTPREIGPLFDIIRKLRARGVTIVYISHRLQEVFEIGDRVTVLRNGRLVATRPMAEVDIPAIVRMMVGREMGEEYPFDESVALGPELLRVEGLRVKGGKSPLSFGVRQGELLGIAGLVGSGRTEAMRALFGADKRLGGTISIDGQPVEIANPRDAVRQGLSLLTEDRKSQGLILDMPIAANVTLTDLAAISRSGLIDFRAEENGAKQLVDDLSIRTPSVQRWVRYLSGGNQQKVVMAKWLFRGPRVLIVDEPTRGIDVGAKYEIYTLLWRLAAAGKSLIIISSDLPELLGICHRIVVFSNGEIAGELARADFSQERVLSLAYQGYLQSPVPPAGSAMAPAGPAAAKEQ